MKIFDLETGPYLSACRKNAFAFLALSIIILSIYSNTFHASWHLDDGPNITENKSLHITDLTWSQIRKAVFASPEVRLNIVTIRPVSRFTLALNWYFGKENVFGYHMVNLLVHIICAVFLFLLIHHTLNLPLLKAKHGSRSYPIALLSTVFWAANPIQTQAVTYIVQRMTSMAAMFYIMTMFFYLKGRTAGLLREKGIFFAAGAVTGLLALGAKENSVMLPVSLLLFDLLFLQEATRKNVKKGLKALLLFFVLPIGGGLLFLSLATDFFSPLLRLYELRPFTLWERLLTEPRVILFYLGLIFHFAPGRLSLDHDLPTSTSLLDPLTTIPALLLVTGMIAGSICLVKRKPVIAFSLLFFFVNHAVESSVLPLELIFEHRNYLPSMFLFLPVAIGLLRAVSFFSHKASMQLIISLFIVLLMIGEAHATFIRNLAWRNEESLWLDCLNKYPNSFRAHHNLGLYYDRTGDRQRAVAEYELALRSGNRSLNNEKAITYFNLGIMAHRNKAHETAMKNYSKARELDPCLPGVHNNTAVLMAEGGGNIQEIRGELEKAIQCGHQRESAMASSNLGILLLKMGEPDKGMRALQNSLKMDPDNMITLKRLGHMYAEKGRWGTAWVHFKRSLRYNAKDINLLLHLSEIYLHSGNIEKARDLVCRSVDSMSSREFAAFMEEGAGKESGVFGISPDMHLLAPLLGEALEKRAERLKKNSEYFLGKSRAGGSTGG
jgi:tetratricopeptide (TPR) repeat protein